MCYESDHTGTTTVRAAVTYVTLSLPTLSMTRDDRGYFEAGKDRAVEAIMDTVEDDTVRSYVHGLTPAISPLSAGYDLANRVRGRETYASTHTRLGKAIGEEDAFDVRGTLLAGATLAGAGAAAYLSRDVRYLAGGVVAAGAAYDCADAVERYVRETVDAENA